MKKLILSAMFAVSLTTSAQLPMVITKLDAASAKFKGAEADVAYDNYVRVVKDHTKQTGKIFVLRQGKAVSMGALFFDPGVKEPSKKINYDGGTLQLYTPGTNQDDVFKAGNNQASYESFLTLGFGGSGTDLAKAWTINDLGSETVNGVKAEKLDLVSKDAGVRNNFTHITLWLDLDHGVSVRQIFFQPNGDTRTADYTNFNYSGKVNKKPYSIPGNATKAAH
ncbi:outer membrane lipoprotein carrier protein LolA [Granulicella cerasi]|uniref:Outer membrane lipoprotein carrier protein LolA n=1 Tax=Granulicella cerasi TaxID=741063 RepID=A0ABW1Z6A5_9BACT|nr:outer membrane lipoprotein-sorting protein [Granulicella cerasi]